MADNNQYFYLKMGIPRGPFTRDEFIQLAIEGKIKRNTSCIRNDDPSQPANVFFGNAWGKIQTTIEQKKQKAIDEKREANEKWERELEERQRAAEGERRRLELERQQLEQQRQAELAEQRLREQQQPPPIVDSNQSNYGRSIGYQPSSNYQTKSVLGIIGSGCLIVGVFFPIIRLPIVGSLNYFKGGEGDGVFVLALGAIALLLTLCRAFTWLWLPGIASLGIMAFSLFNFFSLMDQAKRDLENELAGNPFRGIGEAMIGSVSLDWGWIILIGGGLMVCIAAGLQPSNGHSRG